MSILSVLVELATPQKQANKQTNKNTSELHKLWKLAHKSGQVTKPLFRQRSQCVSNTFVVYLALYLKPGSNFYLHKRMSSGRFKVSVRGKFAILHNFTFLSGWINLKVIF